MPIKVLSARAVKTAVGQLSQEFIRTTGIAVEFDFAPVGAVEKKLSAGEAADAVILSREAIGRLGLADRLAAAGSTILGRTSIGVGVRAGAAKPDISTQDAFKRTLLAARTISVSSPAIGGTSAVYLPKLFARMGIAEALEPKLIRSNAGGGDVSERVARGEADIGITFISEMLPIPGIEVVGPLPEVYGNDTTYCAAGLKGSASAADVEAFIAALTGPHARAAWRAAGFEPAA